LQVPHWCPELFLASLKTAGLPPSLTARLAGNAFGSAAALYEAFIAGPNFAHWFGQQRRLVLHLVEPPEPEEQVRPAHFMVWKRRVHSVHTIH
jgi:hypothetical protein